jgi:hypothetical protein
MTLISRRPPPFHFCGYSQPPSATSNPPSTHLTRAPPFTNSCHCGVIFEAYSYRNRAQLPFSYFDPHRVVEAITSVGAFPPCQQGTPRISTTTSSFHLRYDCFGRVSGPQRSDRELAWNNAACPSELPSSSELPKTEHSSGINLRMAMAVTSSLQRIIIAPSNSRLLTNHLEGGGVSSVALQNCCPTCSDGGHFTVLDIMPL